MRVYLDSSVALRILLADGPTIDGWQDFDRPVTSRLTLLERQRVLDRVRLSGQLDDEGLAELLVAARALERGLDVLPVIDAVLDRAGQPFRVVVGTLDAIHLASALLLRENLEEDLLFATHDRQQGIAAMALGFEVIGLDP